MNKKTIVFLLFYYNEVNSTESHMNLIGQFYKPCNRRNSKYIVTHLDLSVQVDGNSESPHQTIVGDMKSNSTWSAVKASFYEQHKVTELAFKMVCSCNSSAFTI